MHVILLNDASARSKSFEISFEYSPKVSYRSCLTCTVYVIAAENLFLVLSVRRRGLNASSIPRDSSSVWCDHAVYPLPVLPHPTSQAHVVEPRRPIEVIFGRQYTPSCSHRAFRSALETLVGILATCHYVIVTFYFHVLGYDLHNNVRVPTRFHPA